MKTIKNQLKFSMKLQEPIILLTKRKVTGMKQTEKQTGMKQIGTKQTKETIAIADGEMIFLM
jgi:hypothetical protein